MATDMKRFRVLIFVVFVLSNLKQCIVGAPKVPCYFIFGDSLADNGNNNAIQTRAKVNYPPYGIDFPGGPTGRFCNGQTIFDAIAKLLGFDDFISSFATSSDSDVLKGVNYASGSAGIRDESGKLAGGNINLNKQLQNHKVTINRIAANVGSKSAATEYLNKCLYSVGMGSNDYIGNYFLPQFYNTSKQYSPEQYAQVLIDQYSRQLTTLYNDGARKIALFGLGHVGCTPGAIASNPAGGKPCIENMNNAVQIFNKKLKSLVDQLNKNLANAKFIYVNIYGISSVNASAAGFRILNKGCCQVMETGLCAPEKAPCPNRSEYVFWDSYHPTEAANQVTAKRSYNAVEKSDAYPYDISHLAEGGTSRGPRPGYTLVWLFGICIYFYM